jgi:hypothetical protein
MPYITQPQKQEIDNGRHPEDVGELTYKLYRTCVEYLLDHSDTYLTRAQVLGAVNAVSQEFYRREVAPYEEIKRIQNGDIFDEYDFGSAAGTEGEQGGAADPAREVAGTDGASAGPVRTAV